MTDIRGNPTGTPEFWLPFLKVAAVAGVSITVFNREGQQSSICASDETAAQIDELQFDLGEGPRWEALRTGLPVLRASDAGWPIFAASLALLEVSAVFAFPMFLGAVTVGVVDLYSRNSDELKPEEASAAAGLTRQVTGRAVQEALRSADDDTPDAATNPAMRREVHQATGIILVQLETTATDAFLRLRAYAFSSGRGVLAVARDVVAGILDFRDLPD